MTEIVLSASQEDYLEAIYHIVQDKLVARSKDLVQRLDVNSSSVTQALKILAEKGLINYEPYGVVTLTSDGEGRALEVIARHRALRDFFVEVLRLDEAPAEEAACRMEHEMPREILDRLICFIEYTQSRTEVLAGWIEGFGVHCLDRIGDTDSDDNAG